MFEMKSSTQAAAQAEPAALWGSREQQSAGPQSLRKMGEGLLTQPPSHPTLLCTRSVHRASAPRAQRRQAAADWVCTKRNEILGLPRFL